MIETVCVLDVSRFVRSSMSSRILFTGLLLIVLPSANAELVFESGATQVGLLELYTSEGCNSCPPADRWLSSLTEDAALWVDFVPLAFHVDYWDYIGWKDRFASPKFTQRQRAHAATRGLRTIYTPGFLLNGLEWRDWRSRQHKFASGDEAGILSLAISDGQAKITYGRGDRALKAPQVYIAVLGFGLSTEVRAGENTGRSLEHNFVVLGLENAALTLSEEGYTGNIELPIPGFSARRFGIAAWISERGNPTPLQAVGGWLPD